jgi:hypothetical protein
MADGPNIWPASSSRYAGADRFSNFAEIARDWFFGVETVELAASVACAFTLSASLSSSAWSYGADGWTLNSGSSDRYVVACTPPETGDYAVRLSLTDPDSQVRAFLRGSEDGRDCYEGGVYKVAGVYYAQIRLCTDGVVAGSAVTNGASDTPTSAACESDVSALVSAGAAYSIDFRTALGYLELRINNETVARLKHTPLPDGDHAAGHWACGFVAETSGARVLSADIASLTGVSSNAEDILVVACAGDVWATRDGVPQRVQTGTFPATGRVQMEAANAAMLMLGPLVSGIAKARVYDPIAQTVTLWAPTAGTLPGQTVPGTTTAQVLGTHGARIALGRWYGDEQNIGFSAPDDGVSGGYLNWDYASELQGAAFTLASTRPLKLGQPVSALQAIGSSYLIVGCDHAVERIDGEPALGQFDTGIVSNNEGISGDQAIVLATPTTVVAHTASGLVPLSPGAGPGAAINAGVLVTGIQFNDQALSALSVILARDPTRSLLHVFKTPRDYTAGSHLIYDENIGGYQPGRPAFFEQSYPASIQPTCAKLWKGRLLVGCVDGYVREFVDDVYDDEGTNGEPLPIVAESAGQLITSGSLTQDAEVAYLAVQMTPESAPVDVLVYGARTAAKLYDQAARVLLMRKTVDANAHEPIPLGVRAPALMIVLRNDRAGEQIVIEGLEAEVYIPGMPTSR